MCKNRKQQTSVSYNNERLLAHKKHDIWGLALVFFELLTLFSSDKLAIKVTMMVQNIKEMPGDETIKWWMY
jgi:hypothetical protein